jgi:hypothetical protein
MHVVLEEGSINLLEDFITEALRIFPLDKSFADNCSRDTIFRHQGQMDVIKLAIHLLDSNHKKETSFSVSSKDDHTVATPIDVNDDPMGFLEEEEIRVEIE